MRAWFAASRERWRPGARPAPAGRAAERAAARPRTAAATKSARRARMSARAAATVKVETSSLERLHRLLGRDLAALELVEHFMPAQRRRGLDRQARIEDSRDAIQAVLDRRVTDPEQPFHFLDRAVASHERGHE